MKKNFYKLVKLVFVSAILLACVSCADSPKQIENPEQTQIPENPTPEENIIGTWFWNYGYNQDLFANDYIIFNEDKTVYLSHEEPEYKEYDKGTYSITENAEHESILTLNIKWFKYLEGDYVDESPENFDLKLYYTISTLTKEKFIFNRFRRDFSAMGGPVYKFDPPVIQDFSKIKNGTKENLTGTWKFNKRGTPDADWEETWTFNADGTMESKWEETGSTNYYKGEYQVIEKDGKSVLYQKLSKESADGTTFTDMTQPMEFWYDYFIDNENVINVNCTKNKIDGVEHPKNPPIENFYYRVLDLKEVTYHWAGYTFKDYYPKGTDYEVIDLAKPELFTGVHRLLKEQKLLGWYDNSSLNGSALKKISAGSNTGNTELWAKWGIFCSKNVYDETKGKDGYNYNATLPASVLAPGMAVPSKGDTIKVSFSAKVSKDFKVGGGLSLVDLKDEWIGLGIDWHILESHDGVFSDVFEIKVEDNPTTDDLDFICFDLNYGNNDTIDEEVIFSDFEFVILD